MSGERVGIIGVGLIGGSLALALKQAGGGEVVACDPHAPAASMRRYADRLIASPSELVEACDLVVLATPVGAAESLLAEIAPACRAQTIITDVGSTKTSFIHAARSALDNGALARLVPGHPIAGREKSTAKAADATLFQGRKVVLTPLENTDARALDAVTRLWRRAGAEVVRMDAPAHDALFATISHLPHIVAYALVGSVLASSHRAAAVEYAAGGLRDFTRIAESDPVMWRDICLSNRESLLEAMAGFEAEFKGLRDAVSEGDGAALAAFFKRVGEYRRRFSV